MDRQHVTVEQGSEVRERAIRAASDLLVERGLDGMSMRAVADRVGVSATALYHYFENKDALVAAVVESAFREFGRYLTEAAQAYPKGSVALVQALGEAYVRFALERQAYYGVLFSPERPDPRAIQDLPEGGGYDLFRQALVDAMEAGAIRRTNADLLAMYLWAVVHGLVMIDLACRFEERPECAPPGIPASPIELYRAFHDFVWRGILAPGASLPPAGERAPGEEPAHHDA